MRGGACFLVDGYFFPGDLKRVHGYDAHLTWEISRRSRQAMFDALFVESVLLEDSPLRGLYEKDTWPSTETTLEVVYCQVQNCCQCLLEWWLSWGSRTAILRGKNNKTIRFVWNRNAGSGCKCWETRTMGLCIATRCNMLSTWKPSECVLYKRLWFSECPLASQGIVP